MPIFVFLLYFAFEPFLHNNNLPRIHIWNVVAWFSFIQFVKHIYLYLHVYRKIWQLYEPKSENATLEFMQYPIKRPQVWYNQSI